MQSRESEPQPSAHGLCFVCHDTTTNTHTHTDISTCEEAPCLNQLWAQLITQLRREGRLWEERDSTAQDGTQRGRSI